jgi:TraK protein
VKLYFIFLAFACSFLTPIGAAQNLEMDSTNLLKCCISSRHHNRIFVDGQRIKKVIFAEGDIAINIEEESGHIFVQALVDRPAETTVSIVTSEGIVQDLELSFADKSSEILVLRENQADLLALDSCEKVPNAFDVEIEPIQNIIEGILCGSIPEEYIAVDDGDFQRTIRKGVLLKGVTKLIGPTHTIYVLTIQNNSFRRQCIRESEINFQKGDWVYLDTSNLPRDGKSLALIGVNNP